MLNKFSVTHKKSFGTEFAVALVLLLVIGIVASLPVASAHSPPWKVPRFAYITGSPNPIGLKQTALIVFWVNTYPPTAEGAYGDRWTNFVVSVTKPDGTSESLGPFTSDPVGSGYAQYTPQQTGTYKFVFSCSDQVITGKNPAGQIYPGKTLSQINGADSVNDTYLGATSDPFYLNVTSNAVQPWPEAPLPTYYWTRPVNNMNRNWDQLLGNWLSGAAQRNGPTTNFAYGAAVNTPHIMWAKPIWDGGVMDNRFGDIGYYSGLSYEGFGLTPPIVLNGRIYYNVMTPPRYGWWCIDLYTGEKLFFQNTTGPWQSNRAGDGSGYYTTGALSFGQVYNYDSPNQHGGLPYLWATNTPVQGTQYPPNTWYMYDAFTGNYILAIANVSASGTQVYGNDGSITYYNFAGSGANKRLTVWNTSRAIESYYSDINLPTYIRNPYWVWRPILNATVNGALGFSLNFSIPNVQGSIFTVREGDKIIGGTSGSNDGTSIVKGNLWALNLNPSSGTLGQLLWNITFTPPSAAGNITISMGTVDPEDGVFLFSCTQTRQFYGFNLATGNQIWTTPSIESFDFYGMSNNIYRGLLLAYGYGGVLHAYNITTGKEVWSYTAADVGFESPYGNYPLSMGAIADNKIYLYSTEHSPTMPLWRGSYLRCIDVATGHEDWKIANFANSVAIADGYIVSLNLYDNRIYCYGKGPSETTVSASPGIGNAVTIQGTVIDQTVGKPGIPAISDADQEAWMEYVYAQQGIPTNAKGVPVAIYETDPNGNTYKVATVTTDISGHFVTSWTPTLKGAYKITAAFDGSNAYYGSSGVAGIAVGDLTVSPLVTQTPEPTPKAITPTPTLTQPTETQPPLTTAPTPPAYGPSTATYIMISAAIVIVLAVVAALILRRRK
jgi:hypothetical protein